jgi:uncharacterized cupin superfamily protein
MITTSTLTQATDAELEDWGPLPEATGEEMSTHGVELWDIHETVRKVYSIF